MGIVNVTADSFSDGGRYVLPDAAVAHAGRLLAEGAAILDVGGESTRPFADPVPEARELGLVLPVVARLVAKFPDAVISVDTYKAGVAEQCLRAGAHIINDISACSLEPALLDVLWRHKPGYVLMHSQGPPQTMQIEPRYDDVLGDIMRFFEERLKVLVRAGLPEDRVVLDPGIGFGKTLAHNLTILRGLETFQTLGRPILAGVSRKSFLGDVLRERTGDTTNPHERGPATQVAQAMAYLHGAGIHRAHEVREAIHALALAEVLA